MEESTNYANQVKQLDLKEQIHEEGLNKHIHMKSYVTLMRLIKGRLYRCCSLLSNEAMLGWVSDTWHVKHLYCLQPFSLVIVALHIFLQQKKSF